MDLAHIRAVTLDLLEELGQYLPMQETLEARIYDPLWMLTRQWQLGEFQEERRRDPRRRNALRRKRTAHALHAGAARSKPGASPRRGPERPDACATRGDQRA